MNCREAERQIFADRDGALEESQRAALTSHLASCSACHQLREALESSVAAWRMNTAEVRIPDPNLEWRRLELTINRAPGRSSRSLAAWLTVPAALGAAAAVALYVSSGGNSSDVKAGSARAHGEEMRGAVAAQSVPSTVVYVDEKSGWTFVWAPDTDANGQHI